MVINICKNIILSDRKTIPSAATKSASVFTKVQENCIKASEKNNEKDLCIMV